MRLIRHWTILAVLLLTACAAGSTRYQLESDASSYKGQNISAVESKWGMADQTLHARNGKSYYVYNTYSGGFYASSYAMQTNTMMSRDMAGTENYNTAMGSLGCTTIFVTDSANIITETMHQGHNCGGKWVSNKKS